MNEGRVGNRERNQTETKRTKLRSHWARARAEETFEKIDEARATEDERRVPNSSVTASQRSVGVTLYRTVFWDFCGGAVPKASVDSTISLGTCVSCSIEARTKRVV